MDNRAINHSRNDTAPIISLYLIRQAGSSPRRPVACPGEPAKTLDPVDKPRGVGKNVSKKQHHIEGLRHSKFLWPIEIDAIG